jgi:hypothetical protein
MFQTTLFFTVTTLRRQISWGKEKEKNRVVPPILQLHPISSVIKIRNKSSITANNLKGKGNSTKHKVPYKIGGVDYFSEHFAPTFLIPKRS